LDASVDHSSKDLDRDDAAHFMITSLAKTYPGEFLSASENLGYYFKGRKMGAVATAAMWDDANISVNAQRTILRHLQYFFGHRFTVPQYKIADLALNMIEPVRGSVIDDGKTIHFWTKAVDDVVLHHLHDLLRVEPDLEFHSIHIVVGGDHGQTKFGEIIKIILFDATKKVVKDFQVKVGHIDAQKDTYEIFKATIGTSLNESLLRIVNNQVLLTPGADGKIDFSFGTIPMNDTTQQHREVKIVSTGDMAYTSMVLGRVNMSGKWCNWCKPSPAEWQLPGHTPGELWTLESMEQARLEIDQGCHQDTPNNRRGNTHPPLISTIPIQNHIIPLLHLMIGIFNAIFSHLLEYVEWRLEDVTNEEFEAREELYQKEIDLEMSRQRYKQWMDIQGVDLMDQQLEKRIQQQMKKQRNGENRFILSVQERKDCMNYIRSLTANIGVLKLEQKSEKSIVDAYENEVKDAKKQLMKLVIDRGKKGSSVRQKIEQCLKDEFGVDRGASHGGDFEGVAIIKLLNKGGQIFPRIESILLEVEHVDIPNDEIRERVAAYKILCQLLDYIFSLSRTPSYQVNETTISELRRVIPLAMVRWRQLKLSLLMPKIHALWDHLINQMEEHHGISEYMEDFVELMHQMVKQFECRSKMRDRGAAAIFQSRMEYIRNSSGIKNAKSEAMKATSRNIPKKRLASEDCQVERHQKRRALLQEEEARGPPAVGTLILGRELNKVEYLDAATQENEGE
jgi:hypothetical protein